VDRHLDREYLSDMSAKLILGINSAVSLTGLSMVVVYGQLHWWYRSARNAGLRSDQVGAPFWAIADQLRIIALILCALSMATSWLILREKRTPKSWCVTSMAFSGLCLFLSVFVWI
jgi:hypothetical protein